MAADTQAKASSKSARAWVGWLGALGWTALVFTAEAYTAPHFTFEPFYVLAVIYAGWRGGHVAAGCLATICASLGVLAEHLLSEPLFVLTTDFEHPAIPYWNGMAHLIMYLFVGLSISTLRTLLRRRETLVNSLQEAANRIRTLQGLLPVCAWCKQIRDEQQPDRWLPLEQYVSEHTDAQITHGICPSCKAKMVLDREAIDPVRPSRSPMTRA